MFWCKSENGICHWNLRARDLARCSLELAALERAELWTLHGDTHWLSTLNMSHAKYQHWLGVIYTITSDSTLKYIFNKAIFIILHIFVLATDISQHKSVLKYFHCIVFTVSKYFQKIKFDRRNKFYMGRYLLRLGAENCHAIAEK